MQLNLSDVYVFNAVARALNFTAAAREIGFSRSAISKKISRLEKDLGVTLLNRSTRSVSLTESGQTLYQHTSTATEAMEQAVDSIRASNAEPSGLVKLSIPSSLGAILTPLLVTRFQASWPDVKVSINIADREVDLIGGGYDLAIRVAPRLRDSSLISRRIGSTDRILAATPAYLRQFGMPRNLEDLRNHRCLACACSFNGSASWHFDCDEETVNVPCTFPISSNHAQTLVDAACLDTGIVCLPRIFISRELEQGQLQELLTDRYTPESCGIFAVYPHRRAAAKVKVLVSFIERELNALSATCLPDDPVIRALAL